MNVSESHSARGVLHTDAVTTVMRLGCSVTRLDTEMTG